MKYSLKQVVFCLQDNKVKSAQVLSRMVVENCHSTAHTKEQKEILQPFGESVVKYSTCHGVFDENDLFADKQSLLESL